MIIHQYHPIFSVISSLKPILVRVAAASSVVVQQRSLLSASSVIKQLFKMQAYWEIVLSPYEYEGEQMFPIVFTDSIFDKEIEKCDENNWKKKKTKLITSLTEQYLSSD